MATHISQVMVDGNNLPYTNYIANIVDDDRVTPALIYSDNIGSLLSVTGKAPLGPGALLDIWLDEGVYFFWLQSPSGLVTSSRTLTVTSSGYELTAPAAGTPPPPNTSPAFGEAQLEALLNNFEEATPTPLPVFLVRQGQDWHQADIDQVKAWVDPGQGEGVLSFEWPFNWGDASPRGLFTLAAGKHVYEVKLVITTPFNGTAASVSVGDLGNLDRLLDEQESDVRMAETFEVAPAYAYNADTVLQLRITPSDSTQGSGIVIITYQR